MPSTGTSRFGAFAVLAMLSSALLADCHCNSDPSAACTQNSDCQGGSCSNGLCVPGVTDADASGTDASIDSDAGLTCLGPGATCTAQGAQPCCSGVCQVSDAGTATCSTPTVCALEGTNCSRPADCCSMKCNGTCARTLCGTTGTPCQASNECCSGICTDHACAALPGPVGVCKSLGEDCKVATDCCTRNCQGGRCLLTSFCSAANDICYQASDCCNGSCLLPQSGTGPGRCSASVTVPGASECVVGGEPCDGPTNCCSRLCLDLGTGRASCILGTGCRERGEICRTDDECCGNVTSGVTCDKPSTGSPFGRCSNKQSCQPVGNCCGAHGANCEQACCDGQKAVCQQDNSGLSRCFGGKTPDCRTGWQGTDPDCCIAEGAECQFRDQCCNLSPCVYEGGADGGGKYVCRAPHCIAAGARCTPGATGSGVCCDGLSCLSDGELNSTICRAGSGPIGPSSDGGVASSDGGVSSDAGPTCASNGTHCLGNGECCSGLCLSGFCSACKTNSSTCAASSECCSGVCDHTAGCIPPMTCVSLGGTCTGTAECCAGTYCSIPTGAANGTCQAGSSCSSAGQACSSSTPCCQNLACQSSTSSSACAEGEACVCRAIFN